MEFVDCPAGPVLVGLSDQGRLAAEAWLASQGVSLIDEACMRPRRVVVVPAFRIGRYPVTRGQFLRWVSAIAAALLPEDRDYWSRFGSECVYDDAAPVVTVTYEEATLFCYTHGGRLPYSQEWQRAARGAAGTEDPDNYVSDSGLELGANWALSKQWHEDAFAYLLPVDRDYAASWCGVSDLMGNADEFTGSPAWFTSEARGRDGEFECDRRVSYMRCGLSAPVKEAGYSHWIVPHLRWQSGAAHHAFRPTQIGFRVARNA